MPRNFFRGVRTLKETGVPNAGGGVGDVLFGRENLLLKSFLRTARHEKHQERDFFAAKLGKSPCIKKNSETDSRNWLGGDTLIRRGPPKGIVGRGGSHQQE